VQRNEVNKRRQSWQATTTRRYSYQAVVVISHTVLSSFNKFFLQNFFSFFSSFFSCPISSCIVLQAILYLVCLCFLSQSQLNNGFSAHVGESVGESVGEAVVGESVGEAVVGEAVVEEEI